MTEGWPQKGHGFDRVETNGGEYLLVCACGWRSRPSDSARRAAEQWEQHLAEAEGPGK